jgi:hypothetical protein
MYLLNEALAREHSRELARRACERRRLADGSRPRRERARSLPSARLLRHRRQPALAAAAE